MWVVSVDLQDRCGGRVKLTHRGIDLDQDLSCLGRRNCSRPELDWFADLSDEEGLLLVGCHGRGGTLLEAA